MKLRSYSLAETLVASTIFMLIMVVSVSSFSLVKKSNDQAGDLQITDQCSRQLEDYITAEVKSSNFGKRVMGVEYNGTSYYLRDIGESPLVYSGIALFQVKGKFKVIYKSGDAYYFKELVYESGADIADKADVSLDPGADQRLNPKECGAFAKVASGFIDNPVSFNLSAMKPSSDTANSVYIIIVKDAFYRKDVESQESSINRKTFSRIYLNVSNNLGAF